MIKYISKKEINSLLLEINIVNVIKSFINLTKKHNGYFSICPFHYEKTPSFFVDEGKQQYYCFGCHKSGNVITFLMEYKKIDFIKSINILMKQTNLIFKNTVKNNNFNIYQIVDKVAIFYHENLNNKCINNKYIYNFLKNRNLQKNILNKFQIGFAENSWNFLLKKFSKSEDIKKILITTGLIIKTTKNSYDRFRNRLIFPIRDIYGKTLGFGGRIIKIQDKPKYINSPESVIFFKKQELYGLYESNLNKNTKKNYVIIVEGYFDVITLHKNDITNVVGVLGTSFTKNHFKKLKKIYDKLIFCFDGDNAGKIASIKAAYICLSYMDFNTFIGFVVLPSKQDPDSYINVYGKEKFIFLINKSIYIFDYLYQNLCLNLNLSTIHNKLFLINNIEILLNKISNPLFKKIILDHFIKKIQNYNKIKKNNLYLLKKYNNSLSLGMNACILLLKKRDLFHKIDIKKLVSNKNIKFTSDINVFLELVILLRNNINIKLKDLKNRMLNHINIINNNFLFTWNNKSEKILSHQFMQLLNKIYKI